ncbi:hypothetical protein A2Z33_02815 [Candidatus Gottesmanbacteria bacterium RBG_16_52_11]|uniref:SCP domain-containing protein n=1 Tax=Candidatus Gottesmanbacteria bacterium RBG_16_52_11 TaxID=1798374 RepID=A0A1F5YNH1_9BACT|nr:MAG: hypothetical protein A2Z33_02815 [Candidatus Gottesmanbacteria bacterium RBG_16_52_11]
MGKMGYMRDLLRYLFLPHHRNNHRAKVLHIDSLLVFALFLLAFELVIKIGHSRAPDVLGYATDIHSEQLLISTNQKRTEAGLAPLNLNAKLSEAAALKAQHMFANNYWAHFAPDGKSPWDFINAVGYKYTLAGENLAKNFMSSGNVVDAWMASESHRENLLKSGYTDVGFAVVNGVLSGEETTLVVQMFGATGSPVAAQVQVPREIAQAPTGIPTLQPTTVPRVTPVAVPTVMPTIPVSPSPVILAREQAPGTPLPITAVSGLSGVTRQPLLDIPSLSRTFALGFLGLFLAVLTVDSIIVVRHRIVRVTGHPLAHFLFLAGLFVLINLASRGNVL